MKGGKTVLELEQQSMGARNGVGTELWPRPASLCRGGGRNDNPIPSRFLALIDCSKTPALVALIYLYKKKKKRGLCGKSFPSAHMCLWPSPITNFFSWLIALSILYEKGLLWRNYSIQCLKCLARTKKVKKLSVNIIIGRN
jgi:hypothetical protein